MKGAATVEDTIIRVEHVSKLYGLNKAEAAKLMEAGATKDEVYKKTGATVALWDVDLEIPRGKIFVIIGLSGSGKSTMVRCFNQLNRPTSGKVYFEGRDLAEMNKKELLEFRRNKISMVFQSFGLMSHRDVLSNVAYGLEVKGCPGRSGRPGPQRSWPWWACPAGSTSPAPSSPAACGSGWASPGPWPTTRRSS